MLWGNTEVSLVRNAQGEVDYFIVAIQDITQNKLLEETLAQNLTLLKMALDGAQEALWEWDLISGKTVFSPEYYTMLGYLPDEFSANQDEWLLRIHPDEREGVMNKIQDELARQQEIYLAEYRMRTKDGRYRWIQGRGKVIAFDADGKPLKMVGINMDIHERKQTELQVNYLAYHDKLTALPNRVLFFDRFSQAISMAKRDKLHVALLFADLDGFKQVNDEFGHESGDEVLRMASQRLLACTRAADTLSRFGGDEFALIIGNIDDAQQAAVVAKKILQAFEVEMTLTNMIVCRVGISIGISLYPENGAAMDSLLAAADHAMYSCKRQGKNTYAFFSENPAEDEQWIKFNDTHLTGVAVIDEQHRSLVSAVNRLNSALQTGQELSVLRENFDEVIALTAAHFETEGRLMAQSGYLDQRHHEHEHALLVDEAMRMRSRLDEGGELLALQVIKDWLHDHIAHSDKPLAKYLMSQGIG
jgi:diguanylate cyclase (GGDEF)-like protein/hemerythrin-like metal-binding protein/PAS domain S-box-containing protein